MRPIDGDKLIGVFYDLCSKQNDPTAMLGLGYISAFIESKEVAITLDDLRPKGRWVMRGGKRYCSHCGERACVTRDKEDFWYTKGTQFCPNCGADMRGGDTR